MLYMGAKNMGMKGKISPPPGAKGGGGVRVARYKEAFTGRRPLGSVNTTCSFNQHQTLTFKKNLDDIAVLEVQVRCRLVVYNTLAVKEQTVCGKRHVSSQTCAFPPP